MQFEMSYAVYGTGSSMIVANRDPYLSVIIGTCQWHVRAEIAETSHELLS